MAQTRGEQPVYGRELAAPTRLGSCAVVMSSAAVVVGLAFSTLLFVLGCGGLLGAVVFHESMRTPALPEADTIPLTSEPPLLEQIKLDLVYPMAVVVALLAIVVAAGVLVL